MSHDSSLLKLMTRYKDQFKAYLGLLICWIVLLVLTTHYSRDYFNYHCWFNTALVLSPGERFFGLHSLVRDPAYSMLQALGTLFLPFEVFFAALILLALSIKFFALKRLVPTLSFLYVLPYFMVLSFLHEGTQIRIALALSVALWSLIWFAQGLRKQSLLVLCFACAFHLSAATFFLVFLLKVLYDRYGIRLFIALGVVGVILAYTGLIQEMLLWLGDKTNARYMAYSVGAIYHRQNSTGLFAYFPLFVGALTLLVWKIYQPIQPAWQELKKMALISGFLAVVILGIFRFNVVIASRLADLLLLPVVLVLGAALVQLVEQKRRFLLAVLILLLLAYGGARGLVTYLPAPNYVYFCPSDSKLNEDRKNAQ